MTATVAVVGANGRVGRAIVRHASGRFNVTSIVRQPGESHADLATRAVDAADVLVNAAGVAHIESAGPGDLDRLRAGNVELPLALASAAAQRGISMIHISSVKAADPQSSPYAASKREGDDRLEREWGDAYAAAGASLVVIRPFALLFPPLDAGKVRRLSVLRYVPELLVPPIPMPVLSPESFLAAVDRSIDRAITGGATGFSKVEFGSGDRGTMRDIRNAFVGATRGSR